MSVGKERVVKRPDGDALDYIDHQTEFDEAKDEVQSEDGTTADRWGDVRCER